MKYIAIFIVCAAAIWISRTYSDYCNGRCEGLSEDSEDYAALCDELERNKKVVNALLFGVSASIAIILM